LQGPRGIEIDALLAAVKSSAAFRARASEIYIGGKSCRTVETPRGSDGLNQAGEFGSRYINRELGATRRPWPFRSVGVRATLGILIAAMSILSISVHRR
jgi:hypothetical protein